MGFLRCVPILALLRYDALAHVGGLTSVDERNTTVMPIFARRRLRAMIDDISLLTSTSKVNDLLSRLESTVTRNALAAEAELSMLWAIAQVVDVTLEPVLSNGRRPDALSRNLFPSASAVVEVRALSDDSFSGQDAMERTANIISSSADRIAKHAGRHLSFEFLDRSYWDGRYRRDRCVDPAFQMHAKIEGQLREWIDGPGCPDRSQVLRVTSGRTDVLITWRDRPTKGPSVFCRMPPVAYDLENNPIFKSLKKKSKQIKGAGSGHLRVVFLFDAGCQLLRYIGRAVHGGREIRGEEIIWHALSKLSGIDIVCVFSPFRDWGVVLGPRQDVVWNVTYFDPRKGVADGEYERLDLLAAQLPRARFEGYQARQIHRQGAFRPNARGWYKGTRVDMHKGAMRIKISSRLLQEYMAGRLDASDFQFAAFGNNTNLINLWLAAGKTIQSATFETGSVDEDDDYVVFCFEEDWGAKSLRG